MSKRAIFQATKAELSQIILGAKKIYRANKNNAEGSEISWSKAMKLSWAKFKFFKLFLHTTLQFTYQTANGEIRKATAEQGKIYRSFAGAPFTIGYMDKLRNAPRKFRLDRLLSIDNITGTKIVRINSCTTQSTFKVDLSDTPKKATNTETNDSPFAKFLATNDAPIQTKSQA